MSYCLIFFLNVRLAALVRIFITTLFAIVQDTPRYVMIRQVSTLKPEKEMIDTSSINIETRIRNDR